MMFSPFLKDHHGGLCYDTPAAGESGERGETEMSTFMTIAAGAAIGYFLYQYFTGNTKNRISGKLHKSASDKKLAGVCGGLAEYLGIDPTIVRLVWALMVFGWGVGVPLYIVCAIVLPEE